MNYKKEYDEAFELVRNTLVEDVYPYQETWRENNPELGKKVFSLEVWGTPSKGSGKRPRVLEKGNLSDIVGELSKAYSDKWLQYFEEGLYRDSTIGDWLYHYSDWVQKVGLRVIKPRKAVNP